MVVVVEAERQALAAPRVLERGRLVEADLLRDVIDLDDVAAEELRPEDAVHGAARAVLDEGERKRGDVQVFQERARNVEGEAAQGHGLHPPARAGGRARAARLEVERPR